MADERNNLWYLLGVGTQFGLMVAVTMAGLLIGGVYLDKMFGVGPLFTILGVMLGLRARGLRCGMLFFRFWRQDKTAKKVKTKIKHKKDK